jgi:ribonuclease HI
MIIYTDGGADPNPGVGGWGAILVDSVSGERREMSGGADATTNNRMELTAAIESLESLRSTCRVELFTDSTYLRNGVSRWMAGWKRNGWRRKDGDPVKNVDLWQRLESATGRHDVRWRWVKGHAGHELNERADELATEEIAHRRSAEPIAAACDVVSLRPTRVGEVFLRVTRTPTASAWAGLVRVNDEDRWIAHRMSCDSINRCELEAAGSLLRELSKDRHWLFFTRSEYLCRGASVWLSGWKKNDWRSREGSEIKNRGLWERLDRLQSQLSIEWRRGGEEQNSVLDDLASRAREARDSS